MLPFVLSTSSICLQLVLGRKYWRRERSEVSKPGLLIFFAWGAADEVLARGESASDKLDIYSEGFLLKNISHMLVFHHEPTVINT